MKAVRTASLAAGLALVLSVAGVTGQEKGKVEGPPETTAPKARSRGQLPPYWGQIGLSDGQKQTVYQVQNKYKAEIDKLEKQIEEVKSKLAEERLKVLTPEQKKRLEDIIRAKVGGE